MGLEPCALRFREPRQARKGATVSGSPQVPQVHSSPISVGNPGDPQAHGSPGLSWVPEPRRESKGLP